MADRLMKSSLQKLSLSIIGSDGELDLELTLAQPHDHDITQKLLLRWNKRYVRDCAKLWGDMRRETPHSRPITQEVPVSDVLASGPLVAQRTS
jgi:hypothetical protein